VGAEVCAAEVGDLSGRPAVEAVVAGQRLQDPRVHREGLELPSAKKQNAVRDLRAYARQLEQAGVGGRVG
jgi:hypothetical protein